MFKKKELCVLVAVLLLSACERHPFEQTLVSVCGDNQITQLIRLDGGTEASPGFAVVCKKGKQNVLSVFGPDESDGFTRLGERAFEDGVVGLIPSKGLDDSATGLLIALDSGHERRIMHTSADSWNADLSPLRELYTTRYELGRMVLSDMDEDGVRDILLPGLDIWLQNQGSAKEPGPFNRGFFASNLQYRKIYGDVADVNGDGQKDAAYRFPDDGLIRLYYRNGQEDVVLGKAIEDVTAILGGGDLNGDGLTDLVVGAGGMPEALEVRLAVSVAEDEWELSEPVPALENSAIVVARDFDGSGHLDLLAAPMAQPGQSDYVLTYLAGKGNGELHVPSTFSVEDFPNHLVASPAEEQGQVSALAANANVGSVSLLNAMPEK